MYVPRSLDGDEWRDDCRVGSRTIVRIVYRVIPLGQDIVDHFAVDIGEAAIDPRMTEGEPLMVDAEEPEDRGVEVVAGGHVVGRFPGPLVTLAEGGAGPDPGACQPRHERAAVVVAPHAPLAEGHPAELGRPDHERVVEEAAAGEVAEKCGRRLVHSPRRRAEFTGDVTVVVPVE